MNGKWQKIKWKDKIRQKLGQKWLRSTNLTQKRKEICEYFNEVKIAQTYPKNHLRSTHISQNTSFAIENPLNSRSALSSQRSQFFIAQLQYSCFFCIPSTCDENSNCYFKHFDSCVIVWNVNKQEETRHYANCVHFNDSMNEIGMFLRSVNKVCSFVANCINWFGGSWNESMQGKARQDKSNIIQCKYLLAPTTVSTSDWVFVYNKINIDGNKNMTILWHCGDKKNISRLSSIRQPTTLL